MSIQVFHDVSDSDYLVLKLSNLRIGWYRGFKTGIKIWQVRK